jgi:hypothetical protein
LAAEKKLLTTNFCKGTITEKPLSWAWVAAVHGMAKPNLISSGKKS